MAKDKQPNDFLPLADIPCRLGKFSNNLVMEAGEEGDGDGEEVGVFTFPVTEIMLNADQVNALFGDKYTDACWYQTVRGAKSPMPWITQLPETGKGQPPGFEFAKKFDEVGATLAYAESPTEHTTRDRFENCKIGRIMLMPRIGGLTEMRLSLQIKPELGEENLRLQEYQNRRISLTVISAALAKKNTRQQELPLNAGGRATNGEAKEGADQPQPSNVVQGDFGAGMAAARAAGAPPPDGDQPAPGSNGETDAQTTGAAATEDPNEAAAREQVAAFERGTPPNTSSAETH